MISAYFDYSPVGESVLVIEKPGEAPHETHFQIQEPASLVEAIAAFIHGNSVEHVYCNGPALGLSPAIREQMSTQYDYTNCEFSQYA